MSPNSIQFTSEHLSYLNAKLAKLPPQKVIEWAIITLPNLYQTTAFGLTGLAITDMISKFQSTQNASSNHPVDLIFIDTLHHFQETLDLVSRVESKYGATVHTYKPLELNTRVEFKEKFGDKLWENDEEVYDYSVKVEPAHRAYRDLDCLAVFTGRRKSQNASRSSIPIIEISDTGLLKLNPLANWTFDQVESYIKDNDVPYNTLLEQGYLSIGDYHSTVPSTDRSDERAGRWANKKEKTECGLHKDYFKMRAAYNARMATASTN